MSDTFIAILIVSLAIVVWTVRKYKKEITKYLPQILQYVTPSWTLFKKADESGEKDGDKKPGKKPDKKKDKESKKTPRWSALLILLGANIALTLLFPAFQDWSRANWKSVMGINVVIIIMALIAHWDGWFFKTVCVLGLLLIGFGWFLNYTPTGNDLVTEWDNLQRLRDVEQNAKQKQDQARYPVIGERVIEVTAPTPSNLVSTKEVWSDWVNIPQGHTWSFIGKGTGRGMVEVESLQSGQRLLSYPEGNANFGFEDPGMIRKYRFRSLEKGPVTVVVKHH